MVGHHTQVGTARLGLALGQIVELHGPVAEPIRHSFWRRQTEQLSTQGEKRERENSHIGAPSRYTFDEHQPHLSSSVHLVHDLCARQPPIPLSAVPNESRNGTMSRGRSAINERHAGRRGERYGGKCTLSTPIARGCSCPLLAAKGCRPCRPYCSHHRTTRTNGQEVNPRLRGLVEMD